MGRFNVYRVDQTTRKPAKVGEVEARNAPHASATYCAANGITGADIRWIISRPQDADNYAAALPLIAGGTVMAKHTPGPWAVEDPIVHELTIVEAGKPTHEWRFIASCSLPEDEDDQDFTSGEVQANARLIASAPEMLEVLESAKEILAALIEDREEQIGEQDEVARALLEHVKAALAKAEGRAP